MGFGGEGSVREFALVAKVAGFGVEELAWKFACVCVREREREGQRGEEERKRGGRREERVSNTHIITTYCKESLCW